MKKLHLILLLVTVALSSLAQTVGEAFYIYRNDGHFNAFFRDEVDSIAYSNYDADSVYCDEVVMQVFYTPDSIYRIPLAAIDSVGFVTPETVYKEGSIPLEGELFDYLIRVENSTLVFDSALPELLVPGVGDKLVATDITVKLPNGFVGVVRSVAIGADGIYVDCENIELSEAVSQYYGVYEVIAGSGVPMRVRGPHKAMHENVIYNGDLPSGRMNIQLGLSGFVTEKDLFDINAKNTFDITYTPEIRIKITRVVDDLLLRSHTNLLVITDIDADVEYEVSGEAQKEWKKSFLPKQDFLIAGIPVYFDLGAKASLSGEIATAFSFKSFAHIVTDITYFDVSLLPMIGNAISPVVNRVGGDVNITTMDLEWDYLGFRAEFKPRLYARIGLSAISHVAGWVGGEFDFGVKATGELMFDVDRIRNAEPGTAVYDELKDVAKIDIKPYIGAHFMAAAFDDRYTFSLGKDFDTPLGTWYQGRILPGFSETKATALSDTRASVTAKITNDCFIPYTVGFSLYDEDDNHVDTKIYEINGEPVKYWTRNAFKSFSCEFSGLNKEKKYKVYPVIRFFGKYDMLCSPSANLDMAFPVELSDFRVTKKQYERGAFTNDGLTYDYRFDVTVTATLGSADDVHDWGYVYRDPNGREKKISLVQPSGYGTSYTDTRYAYYRSGTPPFTCTLVPYVEYVDSDAPVYGEPQDFPLEYGETSCPDNNHPHTIDLGLPSGTKWACCNVGASAPEQYGNYYAWGETQTKNVYNEDTYQYYQNRRWVNIGSDIACTRYDAATVNWGAPWRMPSRTQIEELCSNCFLTWTTQNGVYGLKFTGPNGGTVFLPAAGIRWDGELRGAGGGWSHYWSSTLYESDPYYAYELYFYSGGANWDYSLRFGGLSVRPVR